MTQEHEIIRQVYAARENEQAADELVRAYMPFIRRETGKFLRQPPAAEHDDALSIAMFAFYEAVMAYRKERGAFLPLAARAIRNRLVDHHRRESRHRGHLSLDHPMGEETDGPTLLDQAEQGVDTIGHHQQRAAAREEIAHFSDQLERFGLGLSDIADNCPKQERTMNACLKALAFARENPGLLHQVETTGKVPLTQLANGAGVERKTLERHRKYLVAILLAYTNGFEIIRGHLCQIAPGKGGRQ